MEYAKITCLCHDHFLLSMGNTGLELRIQIQFNALCRFSCNVRGRYLLSLIESLSNPVANFESNGIDTVNVNETEQPLIDAPPIAKNRGKGEPMELLAKS